MHDVLRQRLLRKIESLPDEQVYQVLDYIEFLESKYVTAEGVTTSGLQKFAEGLEDKLRRRAVSPNTIREAFQLISAADRVLSGVSSAGRQILGDLGQALEVDEGSPPAPVEEGQAQTFEADPRKRRASAGRREGQSTSSGETGGGGSPGTATGAASTHGGDSRPDGGEARPDRGEPRPEGEEASQGKGSGGGTTTPGAGGRSAG
ncbi:MAG: DUF2281 domain-containing protein [Gemmatimonadetes bacterium]|nr:DUF2281 domain-containing protein [Gemmatimonadota bacterium]NNL29799.1 DUF2281 domain-containing protein [Gemmatimonadota bacterium]